MMDKEKANSIVAEHLGVAPDRVRVTDATHKFGCGRVYSVWTTRLPGRGGPAPRVRVIVGPDDQVLRTIREDWPFEGGEYVPPSDLLEDVSKVLVAEGHLPPRGGSHDPAMVLVHQLLLPGRGTLCTPELHASQSSTVYEDQAALWRGPDGTSFHDFFHRVCHEPFTSVEGDLWTMGFYTVHGSAFIAWSVGGEGARITRASCRLVPATGGEPLGPSPG